LIVSVLDLTTLARAKAYLSLAATGSRTDVDTTLAAMITSVSQKLEQYCSRVFKIETVTERRVLNGGVFPVQRTPVVSISSVRASTSGRQAGLVSLDATQYEISPSGDDINVWDMPRGTLVEATYSGGIAADTAAIVSNHPVLQEACLLQVANLWQRHDKADKTGMTMGTGDTQWSEEYHLLKDVKAMLDQGYNNAHRFA
jgi:hypothetical protein